MAGRKSHPLAARIKRLMQKDEDVGRIASATPILIGRALELFLKRLCSNVADYAKLRQAKTITTGHLKAYVKSDEMMDFLKGIVSNAPDLGSEDASQIGTQRRRSRSVAEADSLLPSSTRGRGRGRGRGGGRGRGRRRSLDSESMLPEVPPGASMDLNEVRSPKRMRMGSLPQCLTDSKAQENGEHLGCLSSEAIHSTVEPSPLAPPAPNNHIEQGVSTSLAPPVLPSPSMTNAIGGSGESVQLAVASPFAQPPPELAGSLGITGINPSFLPAGVFPSSNQVVAEEDDYDVEDDC